MADPNDDKTVFAGAAPPVAPPAQSTDGDNALPAGTRLGEFELIGLVGIGGFGIVYLAEDHSLGRRVALKEYMPSSLASRGQGSQVSVKSQRHVDTFEAGRRSFVNEARLLAQFDHPALVKVYRFWEANGTAYMVMPYYEGVTLKRALQQMPAPPDEAWLKRLLTPLLDALEVMHAAKVFHRDIAPDNIMLLAGERPLLLDFGAARHVISDMTQALTVILKPGYAPVEQYAEMPELKQGAWTDIYALAAVIHMAILGKTPPPAVGRMMNDTMLPLAQQAAGRYSDAFLRAIDRGLAVRPADRPQSVAEFRELLGISPEALSAAAHAAAPRAKPNAIAAPPDKSKSSKAPVLIAGAVALAVLAIGGYFMTRPSSPPTPPPAPLAQAPAQVPGPTATPTPEPPPAPAAAPKPFTVLDEIDRIFQERDRDHSVTVALDKAQVRIDRDRLSFRVRSSQPGYLYVLMVGTDNQHFYKLFPNAVDATNRIEAGKEMVLPRRGWTMVAGGPAGFNQFVAVVSASPRDFADTGLVNVDPFAEFPLGDAAALAARHVGTQSPFLGKVVCPKRDDSCSDTYGAAVFTIEEVD
jgi:serine/threonine protein kinase